jgi:CheY-like chemotaxis protein
VGEAASGREALALIHKYSPDLLFLDIQSQRWTASAFLRISRPRGFR